MLEGSRSEMFDVVEIGGFLLAVGTVDDWIAMKVSVNRGNFGDWSSGCEQSW